MLPPEIFDKGSKVVYVCRNPKDACVSYFHHTRLFFPDHDVNFETFEDMFMKGRLDYGDYWFHLKVKSYLVLLILTLTQRQFLYYMGLNKFSVSGEGEG